MANVILIKRKTTAGAPALAQLSVGEGCLNTSTNILYYKKDASTILSWPAGAGAGDMLASTYDPGGVAGDAFDMDNMTEGSTNLILTPAERTAISNISSDISTAIDNLIAGAPGALDTLNELAAALADDASFSATVSAQLATKLDANSTVDGGTIS